MSTACHGRKSIQGHPCFGGNHHKNGRIHLAVAPACNIKCGYCTRRHDCANESRPGVTSRILSPHQALERVREVMSSDKLGQMIKVVGIAGPGDPLANEQTFRTFGLIDREFPQLIKCLSTNGLLLPEEIDRLEALDVRSITVTINALDPVIAARIYSWITWRNRKITGEAAGQILIENQLHGVELAAERGMTVKVNSVLIPGVNDGQALRIADEVKKRGAFVLNVIPLIPNADFAGVAPPSPARLEEIRSSCETIIGQFRHCRQCRADAVGLIGKGARGRFPFI